MKHQYYWCPVKAIEESERLMMALIYNNGSSGVVFWKYSKVPWYRFWTSKPTWYARSFKPEVKADVSFENQEKAKEWLLEVTLGNRL